MAGNNHKPKKPSVPNKMRPERRLKVSSILSEQKSKAQEPGIRSTSTKVPWIRMQGKWLEEAGFGVHTPVRIRVMLGCLVLTTD